MSNMCEHFRFQNLQHVVLGTCTLMLLYFYITYDLKTDNSPVLTALPVPLLA